MHVTIIGDVFPPVEGSIFKARFTADVYADVVDAGIQKAPMHQSIASRDGTSTAKVSFVPVNVGVPSRGFFDAELEVLEVLEHAPVQ